MFCRLNRIVTLLAVLAGIFPVINSATKAPVVSILTVEPGALVYELDGHTAMRFRLDGEYDYVVNWGVFDFNSPNFLYRFVKGETDYMAWPFPYDAFMAEYRTQGRGVTEQVLNLNDAQALRLKALVDYNLQEQNRTYRYNYIYDNCATRPVAILEQAIGHDIEMPEFKGFRYGDTGIVDTPDSPHTFRSEMTRAHADYPWYQLGIDLALGSGLDKEVTPSLRAYAPLYLRDALRRAYYIGPQGEHRLIVKNTRRILPGERVSEPATPFLLTPMFIFSVVLALTICICIADMRRKKITRWFDSIIFSVFSVVGLLLTFLIFVSVHEATSPNWLYLWLNPLCLIPAIGIWIKRYKRVVYFYQICNFALLLVLLAIALFGVQTLNSAFFLLIAADMALSARYIFVARKSALK